MNTSPISHLPTQAARLTTPQAEAAHQPFREVVQHVFKQVEGEQQLVTQEIDQFLAGDVDSLQAMAAQMAKADLSFRFLMELRDKLIASYQEVMRMQV